MRHKPRFQWTVTTRIACGAYVHRTFYEYRGCLVEVGPPPHKRIIEHGWRVWIVWPNGSREACRPAWPQANDASGWAREEIDRRIEDFQDVRSESLGKHWKRLLGT